MSYVSFDWLEIILVRWWFNVAICQHVNAIIFGNLAFLLFILSLMSSWHQWQIFSNNIVLFSYSWPSFIELLASNFCFVMLWFDIFVLPSYYKSEIGDPWLVSYFRFRMNLYMHAAGYWSHYFTLYTCRRELDVRIASQLCTLMDSNKATSSSPGVVVVASTNRLPIKLMLKLWDLR